MRRSAFVFLAAVLTSSVAARADDRSATFFAEGQRLMKEKKYAEACVLFEKALALHAGAGTQFNLADCYEKSARPASALALFRQVESVTRQVGQSERSATAKTRADALEARVPTVVVRAPWVQSLPQASLTLDGKPITAGELEKPIKVDFGKHEAIARVGEKETHAEASIDKEGATTTLVLASPVPETTPSTAAPPSETHDATRAATAEPGPSPTNGTTQRTIGIAAGSVGLLAIGIGGFFALGAKGAYADAENQCVDGKGCPAQAVNDANDARTQANVAGIVMGVGAAALIGGAVLYFTAPRAMRAGIRIVPGGLRAEGTF